MKAAGHAAEVLAAYLGIGAASAQRWAKGGMPVRREGRFTVANAEELRQWLGREAHMPGAAHVLTNESDVSATLKESISALRNHNRMSRFDDLASRIARTLDAGEAILDAEIVCVDQTGRPITVRAPSEKFFSAGILFTGSRNLTKWLWPKGLVSP